MQVLSVASEVYPLIKTGGLADVAGALPGALAKHGVTMRTLLPGYPAVMAALENAVPFHRYEKLMGHAATVLAGTAKGLEVFVLDAPHLFNRPGNPYLGPDGKDWPDNAQRFAALSQVAAALARGDLGAYKADVLHLHDWQAALAAVYLRYQGGGPKTVMTVHNIAFNGQFPPAYFGILDLPPQAFAIDGVEFYGNVSFLKGGLACANAITTVSPTYANEICTADYGMGMQGLLQARKAVLSGIVNGIDTDVWNPETDSDLKAHYSVRNLAARDANKRAIEQRFGLEPGDGIIHGVVSRLTWQKGLDIFASLLDWLVGTGARLALVGTGEPNIEAAVMAAAARHKGRIGVVTKYDEALSHLVQGGCDTMLVPSRFEPCGLTQLYGLRYGCVPVVARTGGLADTIIDANDAAISAGVATGIQFSPVEGASLQNALSRTAGLFANKPAWMNMQLRGMGTDVSWDRSAAAYASLYKGLI
ncbi:MAG: glycogen synthase GlgA [Alphaproteobacteria bacterium]|nr:glycogen synthase GlgA [Alphaproteobacteria bacterium]